MIRTIQQEKVNYKFFGTVLLGFLIFGLKEFGELVNHSLQSIMATIGLLMIFGSPFYFRIKLLNPLEGLSKLLLTVFLFWTLFVIFRPVFSGQIYSENSLHPYKSFGLISYLLPLVLWFGTRTISIQKIFKITFVFSIIGIVYFFVNFNNMQAVVFQGLVVSQEGQMGLGELANQYYFWYNISFFSLLSYEFVPQKYRSVAFLTSFLTLFLMAYFARRGGVFMSAVYFAGMLYLYLEKEKTKNLPIKIFLLGATMYLFYFIVNNSLNSTFSILTNRLNDDTRSGVDTEIIKHLNTNNSWLFGEGIEGAYKHRAFDAPRYTHETGYLYLIIKGGIVYLILYVYLLLHSAYVGFFKSRNRLTKGFALYSFFHIVFLVPFGLPYFGLEYLFVWIAVLFCESYHWRSLTNEQVKVYLLRNK
jgi:hypothetical protein